MTDFRRTQNTFGDAFPTDEQLHGGFNFDNCRRNQMLLSQPGNGQKLKATKTGTTIVGVVYKVIRAAGGGVMDKNCEKIHYIAPNIYCCGAGTAADTENTTALISSQLELHRLEEAKKLVQEAILAGIFNDLGSGSNVDVTTIKKVNGKVEVVKEINCIRPNEVSTLRAQINRNVVTHIPRGATRTSLSIAMR
ncbi:hypothetical protein BBJ28_00019723 [Nothophytophthora sp. Chile5]|nr:hypothetical protein BBJ28_00019723 [Nothophytophthora sp. Chile5]